MTTEKLAGIESAGQSDDSTSPDQNPQQDPEARETIPIPLRLKTSDASRDSAYEFAGWPPI